jgi:hypothetical protein
VGFLQQVEAGRDVKELALFIPCTNTIGAIASKLSVRHHHSKNAAQIAAKEATGPTTIEARAKSALAIKHGLYSAKIVLPYADNPNYDARRVRPSLFYQRPFGSRNFP